MEDDAVAEYEAVAAEFDRQGATEQILAVQERILEIQPDRADVLIGVARRLIELRKPERAEPFAKRALEKDPQQSDAYEVLCDIYKVLGKDEELAEITRALARIYRDRGDTDRARELAQRIPMSLEMDGGGEAPPGPGMDHTESAFLSDDELLDDDFLTPDASEMEDVSEERPFGESDIELDLSVEAPESSAPSPAAQDEELDLEADEAPGDDSPGGSAAAPVGDPDQLLAEASVYLRYGKRDQAIASLEAVVAQEPDHRAALEKLGDARAEGDEDDKAVEAWSRAAALARAEGDDAGFGVLCDRIAALDADAAAALGGPAAAALDVDAVSVDAEAESTDDGIDFEIDVSVGDEDEPAPGEDDEIDVSEDDADAFGEPGADLASEDESIDVVIDDEPEVSRAETTQPDAGGADDGVEFEIDVDLDDDEEAPAEDDAAAASSASGGTSTTTSQQVAEDLEEAEFYYQQQLFDEAEAVYRRILNLAPNHPSALLRLGELAAAKGDDPGAVREPTEAKPQVAAPAKPASKVASVTKIEFDDEPEEEFEIDVDESEPEAPGEDSTEVAELSLDPDEEDEPAVQMDLPPAAGRGRQSGATAGKREERPAAIHAEDTLPMESADADDDEDAASWLDDVQAADAGGDEAADEGEAAEEGGFDLAAELRDVLGDDDDPNADSADGIRSTVDDGFESIFADFKQGVSATLSDDDYETRYDLGIAYREMELYEDAIGEFRLCLESPGRKLESLHMMGLCALDLGRAGDAANHLEQALATPDLPVEQVTGLNFDLGRALEAAGDAARARSAYESVSEADPDFPGVAERLAALDGTGPAAPLELKGESGGFESFDDLVAEAMEDEDDTTEQTESFESFDDVITEAESGGDRGRSAGRGRGRCASQRRGRRFARARWTSPRRRRASRDRKKKISFV